jgi:integrase
LANLRIHDLRRSLGSWQALTGASLQIIGKSLGHTRPETTQIYSRLTLDPVRESVEKATEAIRVAAGGRLPRIGENGGQDNDETQD